MAFQIQGTGTAILVSGDGKINRSTDYGHTFVPVQNISGWMEGGGVTYMGNQKWLFINDTLH